MDDYSALYDLGQERRERLVLGENYGISLPKGQVKPTTQLQQSAPRKTQGQEQSAHDEEIEKWKTFGETTKDRDLDADALPTLADGQSHRLRRGGFQGRGRGNQQFRSAPYPQRGFRGGMSGRDSGKALIFPPRIPPANMQGGMPGTVFFAPTSRQGGLHQGMPSHRGGISDVQFPRGRVGNNITIVAAQPDESSTGKKKKKKNKKKKAAQPLIEPQKSTAPPQYNLKALRQADSNREIMDRTGIFGINQFRAQKLEVQPVQNMVSPRRPAAAFDPGNLADQFSFMQLAKPGSATGNDQAADGSTSGQKGLAASKYAC